MLTLIGRTALAEPTDPSLRLRVQYEVRPCELADAPQLGELYFNAYDPGIACATLPEAVADIEATFAGEYGPLWTEASLAALTQDGEMAAAVLVVSRAPWDGTPDCPFIIEVFTAHAHRRRGLAEALVGASMHVAADAGDEGMALRVAGSNIQAIGLYRKLGFLEWTPA
jgi:ribosomal protein S18 acetylase RimI-like enzyme